MPIRLRSLEVGDILLSRDNDRGIYVYLGRYVQLLRHAPYKAEGYLYCRIGSYSYDTVYISNYAQKYVPDRIVSSAISSIRVRDFGKFNKNPVTFERRLGHADISNISEYIDRLGVLRLERL